MAVWVYLTLEAAISHIKIKQCEGDREINGKHLSKESEIFEASSEKTRNVDLLLNSLNAIISISIESERADHC